MADELRYLHGQDELLRASGDDPYVRWECDPRLVDQAWALGSAVAFLRRGHMRRGIHLNVSGPAEQVEPLLDAVIASGLPDEVSGVSIDQHLLPLAQERFSLGVGGDWDWMWTTQAPPLLPGLESVFASVELLDDAADASELLALNAVGNPRAESQPGEGISELWLGIRREGRIVAAGALHRTGAGAPHLTGIVTHPEVRGQKLGVAVTAALTNAALKSDGVSTLGMYSDNDIARGIYHRLGYRTAHAWASRRFASATSG
ncbi:GNAT family N-acetyltransferase [Yimella sp. cx-51]|uniref:GNAT family N-acetyltransferase n=1 Tax=Yimella sp. cx-51 TaxID=2770551 RepID=UPI00165E5D75|nr:GNAT family N-acetyltransferase [Yimella sp. cx-51]MBC9957534.1 GNAT family N-acetyltransferase [Yimella sp. cx-51]QTH39240.1 GNAT family N-acetyltransferase [Yimella sp. cx-51]